MNCGCIVAAQKTSSKRFEMKQLIKSMKETNITVEKCILNAAHNVNMDCILGWQKNGVQHSYLEDYEDNFEE